jgi:hypothetical protein
MPNPQADNVEDDGQAQAAATGEGKKRRFDRKDFVKPKPSRLVMGIMSPVNRYLILMGIPSIRRLSVLWQLPLICDLPGPGSTAKVQSLDFPESEREKFRQYINPQTAAFVGPNHPEFWTDWGLDKLFSDAISPRMAHWAWYGTVNANPYMQAFWLRNNLIANAPNGTEQAKQHAIDWVKQGYGNLLHPEGSVHWTANKIQPIFGGIIEMAIRTSHDFIAVGDPRPVYAVPMLSKYYFVEDVSGALASELGRIEKKLGFMSSPELSLQERFFSLQASILRQKLRDFEGKHAQLEVTPQNFFQTQAMFQAELLSRLNDIYGEREGDLARQLRAYEKEIKKHRVSRSSDGLSPEQEAARARYRKESGLVAEIRRLDTFQADVYGTEKLTQEQIAETLKRTKRDLVNFTTMDGFRNLMPVAAGWRRGVLRCGEPINVRERVESHRGSMDQLKEELVIEFRQRMQAKLDEIIAATQAETDKFARPNPFSVQPAPPDAPLPAALRQPARMPVSSPT